MRRLLLVLFLTACVAETDPSPTPEELAELDSWAESADGKADLPSLWNDTLAWLRSAYYESMSAIWDKQEFLPTADAALARIRAKAPNATSKLFRARVQRLRTELIDHSEVNIEVAPGTVIRLVGDPKGAGAFVDSAKFETSVGAPLCLTYNELSAAVRAAYVPGAYAATYVCHTVTERVLRALGVGTNTYASQIRTYSAARWAWGPLLPSGNSHDPAKWAVSRSCN